MNHDALFKELLSTFFFEFLQLFAPTVAEALEPGSITLVNKEVFLDLGSGTRNEADLIARARLKDQDVYFLVHVEHQAQRQPAFGERMFRYYAQLRLQRRLPVYPIALFSYRKPATAEPTTYRDRFLGEELLCFRYRVVQLNRLDWRRYLRHPNPVGCALMARMKFEVAERPRVKLQCLRLLATLRLDTARTHLVSAFVDSYLRLTSAEEDEFRLRAHELEPTEEQAVLKLTTSWKEEGIAEGLARGIMTTLDATLPRLFGSDGQAFLVDVRQRASLEQLQAIAHAIGQGADLDALRNLLDGPT